MHARDESKHDVTAGTDARWYIFLDGQQLGPIGFAHLANFARQGHLKRSDLVWTSGHDAWITAETVAGLFSIPSPPSSPKPPEPVSSDVSIAADGRAGSAIDANAQPTSRATASASGSGVNRRNYFVRHWRGELSLPVSYWVNGILGNVLAAGAVAAFVAHTKLKDEFHPGAALLAIVLMYVALFLISSWQIVGTWRSATNYQRVLGKKFWGGFTKIILVIAAVKVVGEFGLRAAPQVGEYYDIYRGDQRLADYSFRVLRDGQELEFSGGVKFGAAKEFQRFSEAMGGLKVVHLNSTGGRILEAERIGALIKGRNLSTYVSAQCLSACTIIFLSGHERFIGPNGRLGFHQPDFPGMTAQDRQSMIAEEERRLRRLGVSARFASRANEAAPGSMWFPTTGELLQERIVTRVVNGFEFALSGIGSAQMGPDQVERVLMGTAKYAAIRRVNPDAYAKIAEIFAKGLQRGMSVADLHKEIYPIGLAVVSDVLPHASPQLLIDFARFMIGVGKKLNADSSGSCYFHFNPQKNSGEFLGAMEKHKDVRTAEDELLLRLLNSFDGKRVPTPAEGEIAATLEKVQRVLIRRFGDDLDLLAADDLPPAKYSAYCSMLVAAYEQALTLPQSESVPLLRFMFANR